MLEFDLKALLDQYGVSYKDKGKNVSKGWINLEICPFCGDSSHHCGIDLSTGGFHCWVCDGRGFVTNLLKQMEVFEGLNIRQIIKDFSGDFPYLQDELANLATQNVKKRVFCEMPKGILEDLPLPHRKYLQDRNFDPDFLIKKYKLQAVYNIGDERFRWRIIAPIFLNGKRVSFVGASIVREKGVVKYLNCPTEDSIVSAKDCFYNYDSVKDIAVIVEGITDVWRMGDSFIATLGKGVNSERIKLLKEKNPKKVFVLYDADAIKDAHKMANQICGIFDKVEVLELDKGDPADLTNNEVSELRNIIWNDKK